ncbi:MAG: mRNA surveillance protein pelota [Candidatus Kariarchaeaceae archaeon]
MKLQIDKRLQNKLDEGFIKFTPESFDDLYTLYCVISPGSLLSGVTSRRIQKDKEEGDRADSGERVLITVTVNVEKLDFHGFDDSLRVSGPITDGPEHIISIGSYHTIDVKLNTNYTLYRSKWSQSDLNKLIEAHEKAIKTTILLVALQDDKATVAILTRSATKILIEFEPNIPRKSSSLSQNRKAQLEFFDELNRFISETLIKYSSETIVIGGPGFTKDQFHDFLKDKHSSFLANAAFISASSGGRSGISEIIKKGIPEQIAQQQQATVEAKYVDEFLLRIAREETMVSYGWDEVEYAIICGAVERLIISDSYLRQSPEGRQKVDELIEKAKKMGGTVSIISSFHDAGEQFERMGGVGALLRFSLPARG